MKIQSWEQLKPMKRRVRYSCRSEKDDKLKGIQVNEYVVNASVTDTNGETQENSSTFRVASVSHFIETEEVKPAFANEEIKVKVVTKNYNNQKLGKAIRQN